MSHEPIDDLKLVRELLDRAFLEETERPCPSCGNSHLLYEGQGVNTAHRILLELLEGERPRVPRPVKLKTKQADDWKTVLQQAVMVLRAVGSDDPPEGIKTTAIGIATALERRLGDLELKPFPF